jgi:hypothetical protein
VVEELQYVLFADDLGYISQEADVSHVANAFTHDDFKAERYTNRTNVGVWLRIYKEKMAAQAVEGELRVIPVMVSLNIATVPADKRAALMIAEVLRETLGFVSVSTVGNKVTGELRIPEDEDFITGRFTLVVNEATDAEEDE